MLSLNTGLPIAKDEKNLIYLYDPDKDERSDEDIKKKSNKHSKKKNYGDSDDPSSEEDSDETSDDDDQSIETSSEEDSDKSNNNDNQTIGTSIVTNKSKIFPIMDLETRDVVYCAGPAGSGKSTMAVKMVKDFLKVYPDYEFFLISRTHYSTDPAFKDMTVNQILIDDDLIKNPIDITKELTDGCIILFDDFNTIQNDKLKKVVGKLLDDILECGRKLKIWCVITNHLVIPNEKKQARTLLNEIRKIVVFPKSGSSQQISYALKQYFGFDKNQIDKVLQLKSRWVMISKSYPMYVVYEHGVYIL
jgi:hypothetical protein